MNIQRIAGLAVAVLGVFLIGYGIYSKNQISSTEREIHKMAQSNNRVVRSAGKELEGKITQHTGSMKWSLVGGILLIVLGGAGYFLQFKKKHHK
jgi:LPXTG-motif cell wall-anchored protein